MNTKNIIRIAVAVIAVIFGIVGCSSYVSYNNSEVALRNEVEANIQDLENVYDKMWKIISQKAQISQEYKSSFDKIYTHIMDSRYDKSDGTLMKWIQESNPNFDVSLYKDLSQSVEILRTEFANKQTTIIDKIREHKTMCETMPGCWLISNKTPIKFEVISSTRSRDVMQTKIDDDVNLF